MKQAQRGFTLIELLVVIAIIGLLSSIILASLNSARAKGADASIKSNLKNLQTQAELFYDSNSNTYTGICADATIVAAITNASTAAGITGGQISVLATAGTNNTAICHVDATGQNYAVDVPLKTSSANSWCVDNTGASKQITAGYLGASDVTCN
jgi:prepilin-type N-terminal cleavage/methylation domain-containing protein